MLKLTPDLYDQVRREINAAQNLSEARRLAELYFGQAAAVLVVEIEEDVYNDETYEDEITEIRAYDAAGNELDVDDTLPTPRERFAGKQKPDWWDNQMWVYEMKHAVDLPVVNARYVLSDDPGQGLLARLYVAEPGHEPA